LFLGSTIPLLSHNSTGGYSPAKAARYWAGKGGFLGFGFFFSGFSFLQLPFLFFGLFFLPLVGVSLLIMGVREKNLALED